MKTREQKIQFLKDLEQGKGCVKSFLNPISAILFIEGDKSYVEATSGKKKWIENDPTAFNKQYPGAVSHEVLFMDFT